MWSALVLAAVGVAMTSCGGAAPGGGDPPAPPTARHELVRLLQEDRDAPRHPGDGEGDARLIAGGAVQAGALGRWSFEFTAGPLGIATGGVLVFQVSPFWGWSPPQATDPDAPGYTTFMTAAPGVRLRVEAPADGLMAARIEGRPLASGERIRIDYGAGTAGARADRFAERDSAFFFAVDADGDGVRKLLPNSPVVEITPGPPAELVAHVPSVLRPGERARLVVAVVDARGNATAPLPGPLTVVAQGGDARLAAAPTPEDLARGRAVAWIAAGDPGVVRFAVRSGTLATQTNPMHISRTAPRILWADLHGHSNVSDGTGRPEDYFTYARDVAGLDVASLTDHDHWGLRPLDADPVAQRRIADAVAQFDQPGRFVALPGYEWTSWIYGHRHVLFFDGAPARLVSSLAATGDSPGELWSALAGRDALTIPHHTAGGPIAIDWDIAPDPAYEPVTEVVSVHGSSEADDSPARIYAAVRGHFARDALDRGYRLGFVGSGDSHDGHPGLAHLNAPTGGLAALVGADPDRRSVFATLRARRVYATSGPRILLRVAVGGTPMGGILAAADRAAPVLTAAIHGTAELERVDVIRGGTIVWTAGRPGGSSTRVRLPLAPLARGEYVYVRVVQRDGGLAWSSPIFAE